MSVLLIEMKFTDEDLFFIIISLSVSVTSFPSLSQATLGAGTPLASQWKVTDEEFSFTIFFKSSSGNSVNITFLANK